MPLIRFSCLCMAVMSLLTAAVAADPKPLKVYLMAGQSNMEGHAHARVIDYLGDDPATAELLSQIKAEDGSFRFIKDTWISYLTGVDGRMGDHYPRVWKPVIAAVNGWAAGAGAMSRCLPEHTGSRDPGSAGAGRPAQ